MGGTRKYVETLTTRFRDQLAIDISFSRGGRAQFERRYGHGHRKIACTREENCMHIRGGYTKVGRNPSEEIQGSARHRYLILERSTHMLRGDTLTATVTVMDKLHAHKKSFGVLIKNEKRDD
jgi:hypothetical protein